MNCAVDEVVKRVEDELLESLFESLLDREVAQAMAREMSHAGDAERKIEQKAPSSVNEQPSELPIPPDSGGVSDESETEPLTLRSRPAAGSSIATVAGTSQICQDTISASSRVLLVALPKRNTNALPRPSVRARHQCLGKQALQLERPTRGLQVRSP
jgi:hypothetical protein